MKKINLILILIGVFLLSGCSIEKEKLVLKDENFQLGVFNYEPIIGVINTACECCQYDNGAFCKTSKTSFRIDIDIEYTPTEVVVWCDFYLDGDFNRLLGSSFGDGRGGLIYDEISTNFLMNFNEEHILNYCCHLMSPNDETKVCKSEKIPSHCIGGNYHLTYEECQKSAQRLKW